ncbi:hypothetical protein J8631_00410 [Serratia fonticola]|uniref:DUF6236 family protein n=1 Tax=Serratia fonticola TaxID=47917 RepID=UPI001AE3DA71|nr:DUF6236 family protein [Serratia fonticola]MBP1034015.1 hypothetical protein [Serratia fonticola]
MKRGVVCSSRELIKTVGGFSVGKSLSPIDVNYFTLYWDKLVVPTNDAIHFPIANEKELVRCGVLERPVFKVDSVTSSDYPSLFAGTQLQMIDILREEDRSSIWSAHFMGNEIHLPPDESIQKLAIQLDLTGLLPVPTQDTPLHEILEFKERRAAELIALHECLDASYLEILSSGDIDLQRSKTISKLKESIADINKLNREGWRTPITASLSVSTEFDLGRVYAGVSVALAASQQAGMMAAIGSGALAFLAGSFKIKPVLQSMRIGTDKNLAYLARANYEEIIGS